MAKRKRWKEVAGWALVEAGVYAVLGPFTMIASGLALVLVEYRKSHQVTRLFEARKLPRFVVPACFLTVVAVGVTEYRVKAAKTRDEQNRAAATTAALGDIKTRLAAIEGAINKDEFLKKYPLGYALFGVDRQTTVIPHSSERILATYRLHWDVVRITRLLTNRIEIRLPDIEKVSNGSTVTNIIANGPSGTWPMEWGASRGNLTVWARVLSDDATGIVAVVGLDETPAALIEVAKRQRARAASP